MAKIVLNYEGPEGTKLKRALEAFALERGESVEAAMLPYLRGIAQQIGLDANDDESDQEGSLSKAERRANKAGQARKDRAAEAAAKTVTTEVPPTTK